MKDHHELAMEQFAKLSYEFADAMLKERKP